MAKKKVEQKMRLDRFHERGFSLSVNAVIDLDFSDDDSWRPVTVHMDLENGEHLDLLRAIVKRNHLNSEETCEEDGSVTLLLTDHGLSFTLTRP